jgi:uncharacterized protein (DUF2236 family)
MSVDSYLGPQSVAWRVHSDPSALVGGIRSLMVQTLDPRAMAGVAQHSVMRTDLWGRLHRTNEFVLTMIYGKRDDADKIAAVVRAVHDKVVGFDHFTGTTYAANEPQLLSWVHNATVSSYLVGYRRHGGWLSQSESDQYVSEMRILGELMGVDRSSLPANESQLDEYFATRMPELNASPEAKEAVRLLLKSADLPAHLQPLWRVPAAEAYASLPWQYRKELGVFQPFVFSPGLFVGTSALVEGFRRFLPRPPLIDAAMKSAS